MAVGLAVNEFVANSMKHAFPDGREGTITIVFQTDGDDHVLRMSDDGVGMPMGVDPHGKGLGLRVMTSLAQQLGGSFTHDADLPGTVFTLRFPGPCAAP